MRAFHFRDGVLLLCPHPTDVVRAPSGVSLIRAPILCHCSVTQLGPAQLCSVVRPYGLQRTPILLITSSPSKNFTPKPPHNEIKSSIYGFLVAQAVKNLLTMHENRALGQRSLEKGMVIHSNIRAWRILWTEEPGRLQPMGSQRIRHNWVINTSHMNFLGTQIFSL